MLNFHISCPSIRQFKQIMQEIATVEFQCYPVYMQSLQNMDSRHQLQDYCESKDVFILQNSTTYVICTDEEIVDFASSVKLSISELLKIKEFLIETFGNRQFFLDARKTTSYKLIKFLERRGEITIISEEEWEWGAETFYSLNVRFN